MSFLWGVCAFLVPTIYHDDQCYNWDCILGMLLWLSVPPGSRTWYNNHGSQSSLGKTYSILYSRGLHLALGVLCGAWQLIFQPRSAPLHESYVHLYALSIRTRDSIQLQSCLAQYRLCSQPGPKWPEFQHLKTRGRRTPQIPTSSPFKASSYSDQQSLLLLNSGLRAR